VFDCFGAFTCATAGREKAKQNAPPASRPCKTVFEDPIEIMVFSLLVMFLPVVLETPLVSIPLARILNDSRNDVPLRALPRNRTESKSLRSKLTWRWTQNGRVFGIYYLNLLNPRSVSFFRLLEFNDVTWRNVFKPRKKPSRCPAMRHPGLPNLFCSRILPTPRFKVSSLVSSKTGTSRLILGPEESRAAGLFPV